MTTTSRLENFDLRTLDLIERHKFESVKDIFPKAENLQMIIDTSKFEDLSEGLQEIKLEQQENY